MGGTGAAACRLGDPWRVATVGRLRSIRRGSSPLCEADRGGAGCHLQQPRQPVGGAHEPSGLWEEHPAGRLGKAGRQIERQDNGDEPDRVSKIQHAFLLRPRRDRTFGRYDQRARSLSAGLAGTDARTAHTQAHLGRRRVLVRRERRRSDRDHAVQVSAGRFDLSRRSTPAPGRCSARRLTVCPVACR